MILDLRLYIHMAYALSVFILVTIGSPARETGTINTPSPRDSEKDKREPWADRAEVLSLSPRRPGLPTFVHLASKVPLSSSLTCRIEVPVDRR